ncbi:MAG: hypothetical protein KY476_05400 [Planctomycetes bacterium]|nr:hypothetical protein [Planctomycetota bacterium]
MTEAAANSRARPHEFTIWLGRGELTDELLERLWECGCDDGTVGQVQGELRIDFAREAESLQAAICSAIADVRRAGCAVDRVEASLTERWREFVEQTAGSIPDPTFQRHH